MMLSVVIQAGGESRRMGINKALLPFHGQKMIERIAKIVAPLTDELLITTNQPEEFEFLKLPVYPDLIPGKGALGGFYTALSAAQYPFVAVVACDTPFLSAVLLTAELKKIQKNDVDVVIPRTEKGLEPFHAVYRRETCRSAVEVALSEGQRRMVSWFKKVLVIELSPEEISRIDPDPRIFLNINTPEEFNQINSMEE
jgi:molybdopterin-guanine dinucleotide biosynthesis protein A